MYCQKCGTAFSSESKFCEKCGAPVGGIAQNDNTIQISTAKGRWILRNLVSGRLSRLRYLQGLLFAMLPFFVFVTIWGITNLLFPSSSNLDNFLINSINNIIIPVLFALAFLFFFAVHLILGIRRFHDFGQSGLWLILSFVPYLGLAVALVLLLVKGDSRTNQYGAAPIPKRKSLAEIFNY